MRISWVLLVGVAGAAAILVARLQDTRSAEPPSAKDEPLRRELIQMADRDQRARAEWKEQSDEQGAERLNEVDAIHARRMKAIVDRHGWPGKRLVGTDGAHAAWLLIQHATGDVELMKDCHQRMAYAVETGDASRTDLAYLRDRVRMLEGRPQLFGTQFHEDSQGRLQSWKIEDAGRVDQRRMSVGLPTLAEYQKLLRRYAGQQPADGSESK